MNRARLEGEKSADNENDGLVGQDDVAPSIRVVAVAFLPNIRFSRVRLYIRDMHVWVFCFTLRTYS